MTENDTYLVGLTGPMGCGKSHIAKALRDGGLLGQASIVSYATPLKEMVKAGFPQLPEEALYGSLEDKSAPQDCLCGHSTRHAMQTLGTEWGREQIGPDLWLKAWAFAADYRLSQGISVLADDVRFENEIVQIARSGGQIFYLDGRGKPKPKHPWWQVWKSLGHASERPLNLCKNVITIDNPEGRSSADVVSEISTYLKPLTDEEIN